MKAVSRRVQGTATDLASLRRLLATFSARDVLVVSDEYPPDTVGGAEISLHALLSESDLGARCLVMKFTGQGREICYYRIESIDVLVFPRSMVFGSREAAVPGLGLSLGPARRVAGVAAGRGANASSQDVRIAAMRTALARPRAKGGYLLDALAERYRDSSEWLNTVLRLSRFRTVLADNARSIVAVHHARRKDSALWSNRHSVAYVRDNRFHCARRNQLVQVAGRPCATCDFACAAVDAPRHERSQRTLLQAVSQVRRRALAEYDDVVVTSAYLKHRIQPLLARGQRLHVVPSFVLPQREWTSPEPTERADVEIVTVVGALSEAKGQYEFVRNILDRLHMRPGLHVHLLGRGTQTRDRIQALCRNHADGDRIHFRGHVDQGLVHEAIKRSRLVVLPTVWPEPFGRVPLEAATCSTPCVAFDVGAIGEVIVDGVTGCLVPPGDYDALWNAIAGLLADDERRSRMGRAAFRHGRSVFHSARSVDPFLELLDARASSPAA